jgi:hypothetical protein
MSMADADAHQRKHGFKPLTEFVERAQKAQTDVDKIIEATKLRGARREMNKTEHEFNLILEAQKRREEIQDYVFEGVRLAWGDCMVYKPDFSVHLRSGRVRLVEVKGAFIRDRDIVRFKGCRAEWKKWFDFEFWQRDRNKQWNRLL